MLIQQLWKSEDVPHEWKVGYIVRKKETLLKPVEKLQGDNASVNIGKTNVGKNYRGIMLLSTSGKQMQEKTTKLDEPSTKIGLKINQGKTDILRINNSEKAIKLKEGELEEESTFTLEVQTKTSSSG